MKNLVRVLLAIAVVAPTQIACTTYTTDDDLAEDDRELDAAARGEAYEAIGVMEEGGENNVAIDGEAEEVERESDL